MKEKKSLLERLGLVEKEELETQDSTKSFLDDDYMNEIFDSEYNKIQADAPKEEGYIKEEAKMDLTPSTDESKMTEEASLEDMKAPTWTEETGTQDEAFEQSNIFDIVDETKAPKEDETEVQEGLIEEDEMTAQEDLAKEDEITKGIDPTEEEDEKSMDEFLEDKKNQKITKEASTSLFEVEEETVETEENLDVSTQEDALEEQASIQETLLKPDSDTEFISVKQVYERESLQYDKKRSIFMVDAFINALPKNLPYEVKRQSVLDILKASELDINALLGDGHRRLKSLKEELDIRTSETDRMVSHNEAAIYELETQIEKIKESTRERKQRQRIQKEEYEYETQKIEDILRFIHPEE